MSGIIAKVAFGYVDDMQIDHPLAATVRRIAHGSLAALVSASMVAAAPLAWAHESASPGGEASVQSASARQLQLSWLGGPTLRLSFGPISIITDPVAGASFRMFDPNSGQDEVVHQRLGTAIDPATIDADYVLLSHDHPDHLDEEAIGRLRAAAHFLVPAGQADALRGRGVANIDALAWDATHVIERGGYQVRITAVPAQHSESSEVAAALGRVNGYWIEFTAEGYERSLYWTGDSFYVEGLSRWPRSPDIFVPHLGAVGGDGPFGQVSMNAQQAVKFAEKVAPKMVLPIHHSTFSLYREPISNFVEAAWEQPWQLYLLREGEVAAIE